MTHLLQTVPVQNRKQADQFVFYDDDVHFYIARDLINLNAQCIVVGVGVNSL